MLYYEPSMSLGYADYHWHLLQFDKTGQMIVAEEDEVEFTINPEQYQFDVQAIYDFTVQVDKLLQDAVLIVSAENGELQYSTVNNQVTLSAESYLGWLHESTEQGTLLERLQEKQEYLYFCPQDELEQWLEEHRNYIPAQQELRSPLVTEIGGRICVSFELYWKSGMPVDNPFIGTYALSTHDYDNGMEMRQGRRYYEYNLAEHKWILLQDDSIQNAFSKIAERWAHTFAVRDGAGRYALMDTNLQKQIDSYTMNDDFARWMPVWITGDDGIRGMFLRGSSPWVDQYQIEIHVLEGTGQDDYAKDSSVTITYDMVDSTSQHYIYQEVLTLQQTGDDWQVSACTITIDEIS